MRLLDLAVIQSNLAPIAAPIAPATVYAVQLAKALNPDIGGWAVIAGIASAVGLEFTGAVMCREAERALSRRDPGAFWAAALCTLVYAGLAVYGLRTLPHPETFAALIGVSLVSYVGYALYQRTRRIERERQSAVVSELETTRAKAELARAEAARMRAEWKVSNLSGKVPESSEKVSESSGDWRKLSDDERQAVMSMSIAEIMQRYHVCDKTAKNWKARRVH